jgi:hypothetical protein
MSHDERACGIVYRPGGKSRVAPGPVNSALLHAISIVVYCCFGEMSLGVNRAILHQPIAIVKDQISVDFDIPSIKLVGLQVDFSNQKIKSRCERATGGFSASLNSFTVAGQINCRMRQELWLRQSSGQESFIFDRKWPLDSELIRLFVFDCDYGVNLCRPPRRNPACQQRHNR